MDKPVAVKEGYLKKKSSKPALGWDKRYFKRTGQYLSYSKQPSPFEVIGRIPLNSVICVEKSTDRDTDFNVVERAR